MAVVRTLEVGGNNDIQTVVQKYFCGKKLSKVIMECLNTSVFWDTTSRSFTGPYGVMSQKIELFNATAVRTLNPIKSNAVPVLN
jgi:hypothetical protein